MSLATRAKNTPCGVKLLSSATTEKAAEASAEYSVRMSGDSRQWPEVYDLCQTFLHVAHGRGFFHSRNVQKRATKSDTSGHCLEPDSAQRRPRAGCCAGLTKNWHGSCTSPDPHHSKLVDLSPNAP